MTSKERQEGLLEPDHQQPKAIIRALRFVQYNIEETLLTLVVVIEFAAVMMGRVPMRVVLTTLILTAIIAVLLGGI